MSKRKGRKAGRVVRYKLADGTLRIKHYGPYVPKAAQQTGRTIADLLASWERSPNWAKLAKNTQAQYLTYAKHLLVLQHAPVHEVKRSALLDLRDAVIKSRGNGAGIGFARTASAAFGWAVDRGWLEHSPATRLQRDVDRGHLPAWTEADLALAMLMLPEHLRRAVVLAVGTGQRRGDLIALHWKAFDGHTIRLTQEKTSQPLVIPLLPDIEAELGAWKRDASSITILANKFGKPWRTGANLSQQLGAALAQIEGFPPGRNIHGLRKLAATRLAEAGCTIHEIASITGHQSLGMLQLYTRSVDQERSAESASRKLAKKGRRTARILRIQDRQ